MGRYDNCLVRRVLITHFYSNCVYQLGGVEYYTLLKSFEVNA